MPRKKTTAPKRLDDEEQKSAAWRMLEEDGEENAENVQINKALTESGGASNIPTKVPETQDNNVNDTPELPTASGSNREEQYTVVFDDDAPLPISSDDEDYIPETSHDVSRPKKSTKKKSKRKTSSPMFEDMELESLIEDTQNIIPVVKDVSGADEWWSPIGKLDITIDLERHQAVSVQVPDRPEFWIYVSNIPGRSFLYYEWFDRDKNETEKEFGHRQRTGKADNVKWFYLKDITDTYIIKAFGSRQKILHLKFHKYYDFTGVLELKVCINSESLVKLSHPSDSQVLVSHDVRAALNICFDLEFPTYQEENKSLNHDIDQLYTEVKKYHSLSEKTREERVMVNPQHRSLLPKLRPYQANAVRWMLEQERYKQNLDADLEEEESKVELHPLFQEVKTHDGTVLYLNSQGGYLVKEKPLATVNPPGGILADEMGLGKTVEVLACMLCNPRTNLPVPEFREPIKVVDKKKKRRRIRTPSPVEFHIKDSGDEFGDSLPTASSAIDHDYEKSYAQRRIILSDEEEATNIAQVDGGADAESDISEEVEDDADSDFVPSKAITVKPRAQKRKKNAAVNRVFSDKRTVYYHEDFDSMSDDDEYVPPKKKRAAPRIKKDFAKKQISIKKAKVINTQKKHDDDHPTYSPFKNGDGEFNSKSASLYEMIVKAVHSLSEGKLATDGVSVIKIKSYITKHFNKPNIINKNFSKSITLGVTCGQFIRTSNSKGACGSITLNLHFNPNDTRGSYAMAELPEEEQTIEEVITRVCYDGKQFEFPHVPEMYEKALKKKEKEKGGELYSRMKTMYEMSLPVSLAFYASGNRGKAWRNEFFNTKVEQRSYFECICGGTEEASPKVGYRVQCADCSTEQHAECVKYDITDPYRGEYVCPHCWVQRRKVPSGATLIVTPSSISFQWIEEMQKHIRHKDIKMLFYKGSKETGYMQPCTLAKYDIVVTTYEILAAETNYVDLPHTNSSDGRRFRNPKRYMAMPSPIICIEWWRICLDEAQMIESTTTKTAEMALRLSAVNRWCVTGTPVGKSVNDLQGLLLFLQIDPYMVEKWWRLGVYEPFCYGNQKPLEKVLCNILWRTCKKDVLNQIDIPGQTEETHWLQFSPVEEHFYRQQHIEITQDMMARLNKYLGEEKLSNLDRKSLSSLLQPLLRLRQACCHPQAVRGQFMSLQKSTMTMEELLDQLINKATVEAEESHRLFIAALNGLAGIDIIQEKWTDAVDKYREVLRSATEQDGRLKTDTLQKLHTVTNLAELLEAEHAGISPTMRDSQLREEAKGLKEYYMAKYFGGLTGAKEAVEPASKQVEDCNAAFTNETCWYDAVIDWVEAADQETQILKLVHEEMAQFYDVVNEKEFKEIKQKYPNSRIVLYKIFEKLEELNKKRSIVQKDMQEISTANPEDYLHKAIECHLRVSTAAQKNKNKCKLCEVHENIEIYENTLFHFVKGEIKGSKGPNRASVTADERKELEKAGVFLYDEQKRGTWSDSEAERLLRAVQKYARHRQVVFAGPVLEDGNNQAKLFEALKKEFRLNRIFWRQIYDNVAGVDELNMSTMRLRLRYETEDPAGPGGRDNLSKKEGPDLSTRVKEKVETIYILERHELESQKLKLLGDKLNSQADMRKKLGQLLYLQNLKTTDYGKKGGNNPEQCPICTKELGSRWSVLQCGHCYCVDCIAILIKEFTCSKSTKCAVCRCKTSNAEISYVSTRNEHEDEFNLEEVKGSHSTKVEAVVKSLIKIRTEDEDAKSLVFSTWPDVLDILANALDENDIPYASLHNSTATTQNKFKWNLQKFKKREDVKVLLMPISRGANGLNLIEASHVLLVEPLLNPAQEMQAIGRVHRIGQKKATFVHRFLVKQTIEERIDQMLRLFHKAHLELEQGGHSTEENLLTIQDLSNLFVETDETAAEENEAEVEVPESHEESLPAIPDTNEVDGDENKGESSAAHNDLTSNAISPSSASHDSSGNQST